jgi:hypothetical protein
VAVQAPAPPDLRRQRQLARRRLIGDNRNDVTQRIPPVRGVPPILGRRGRPRRRPQELFPTAGVTTTSTGGYSDSAGSLRGSPAAASPTARPGPPTLVVERGFAWLHAFERLRTRYERRAGIHLRPLQLACAPICHRPLTVVLR